MDVTPYPAARSRRPRILYVHASHGAGEPWVGVHPLLCELVDWDVRPIAVDGSLARAVQAFRIDRLASYDLVICSEYFCAFGVAMRLRLSARRTQLVIWGLNQSRRGLDRWPLNLLARWAFTRSRCIVTHSTWEADLFAKSHGLPRNLFRFFPWGFDVPPVSRTEFSDRPHPYVCLVGRNNRDLVTFCEGIQAAGVRGIVITSRLDPREENMLRQAGIDVYADLDLNACFDCIRHSIASAVLLKDDLRGAGHITMVAAMQFGVPQIVTRAKVTRDYFSDGVHGLGVDFGDASQFGAAVRRLASSPSERQAMGEAAKRHALSQFSHESVVRQVKGLLVDLGLIREAPQ